MTRQCNYVNYKKAPSSFVHLYVRLFVFFSFFEGHSIFCNYDTVILNNGKYICFKPLDIQCFIKTRFNILYWIQFILAILAIELTFKFGLYFAQELILVNILKYISNLLVK